MFVLPRNYGKIGVEKQRISGIPFRGVPKLSVSDHIPKFLPIFLSAVIARTYDDSKVYIRSKKPTCNCANEFDMLYY